MKKRLVLLCGEFYLLDAEFYMTKMAKDYPADTRVFCMSETDMEDPDECIRKSGVGDNCYACLPLIASTTKIDNLALLDRAKCEEAIKTAKVLEAQVDGTEWEILDEDLF